MTTYDQTKNVLEEALQWEINAEKNCDQILHELRVNGFHDVVEKIKNDEHRHQAMVQELLGFLK